MKNTKRGYFLSIIGHLLFMAAAGSLLLSLYGGFGIFRTIFVFTGMGISVAAMGFNAWLSHYFISFFESRKETILGWIGFLFSLAACFFSITSMQDIGYSTACYLVYAVSLLFYTVCQLLEANNIWKVYQNLKVYRLNMASTTCLLVAFLCVCFYTWSKITNFGFLDAYLQTICLIGDVIALFGGIFKLSTISDVIAHLDSLNVVYGIEEE